MSSVHHHRRFDGIPNDSFDNETLRLIAARTSTRTFASNPVTDAEKEVVLSAALRAPSGGAMMLYSILEIEDQELKNRLAQTCDDQPFIAKAPWVLVFVADYRKWVDLFEYTNCANMPDLEHRSCPGVGELLLACSDALIAAQTAAIAAESIGIGSCYIGDVIENMEIHRDILNLPSHTFPVAMLVLGHPASTRRPTPHPVENMVMRDTYARADGDTLFTQVAELEEKFAPHGNRPGYTNYVQALYARKYISNFVKEMNRSTSRWLDYWVAAE